MAATNRKGQKIETDDRRQEVAEEIKPERLKKERYKYIVPSTWNGQRDESVCDELSVRVKRLGRGLLSSDLLRWRLGRHLPRLLGGQTTGCTGRLPSSPRTRS